MVTDATNTDQELLSDLPIPPGETVLEGIEYHGLSMRELAEKIELSSLEVDELIKGEMPMTQDIAEKLENVLDIPAYMLLGLEEIYRRTLMRQDEQASHP